jgi:hypothetical protein
LGEFAPIPEDLPPVCRLFSRPGLTSGDSSTQVRGAFGSKCHFVSLDPAINGGVKRDPCSRIKGDAADFER